MEKKLLFSLSKAKGDFIVQPFKGSGKGGQKRNKTMSACRITHPASGTVSECQEERSFTQNKHKAFERLIEKESFQRWHKLECIKRTGEYAAIMERVDKSMRPENIKVECLDDGKWVECTTPAEADPEFLICPYCDGEGYPAKGKRTICLYCNGTGWVPCEEQEEEDAGEC